MKGTYAKVQSTVQTWFDTYGEEIPKRDVIAIHYTANPATVVRAYNMAIGDLRRTEIMKREYLKQNWQQFKVEIVSTLICSIMLGFILGLIIR